MSGEEAERGVRWRTLAWVCDEMEGAVFWMLVAVDWDGNYTVMDEEVVERCG